MGIFTRSVLCWAATGLSCVVFSPAAPQDLVGQARIAAQTQCRGGGSERARALLDPALIDTVEPAYAILRSARTGELARLKGARIRLRPLPGATPEWVTRELECHNVRRTLGSESGPEDDPYYVPGVALTFVVESGGDSLLVRVETSEVADAEKVLARARGMLRSRATAPSPR